MNQLDAVFSIRPNYCRHIFDGTKRVEFRKGAMTTLEEGHRVGIYETQPTSAIVGSFEVVTVITTLDLSELIRFAHPHMKQKGWRSDIRRYFSGSRIFSAVIIDDVRRYSRAVPIHRYLNHPPMSWAVLKGDR